MTAIQPSASIVREPDRVRVFLCQTRPSKLLDIAVARQRSGKLTFVVASVGIPAQRKSNCLIQSAPKYTPTFDSHIARKNRPDDSSRPGQIHGAATKGGRLVTGRFARFASDSRSLQPKPGACPSSNPAPAR